MRSGRRPKVTPSCLSSPFNTRPLRKPLGPDDRILRRAERKGSAIRSPFPFHAACVNEIATFSPKKIIVGHHCHVSGPLAVRYSMSGLYHRSSTYLPPRGILHAYSLGTKTHTRAGSKVNLAVRFSDYFSCSDIRRECQGCATAGDRKGLQCCFLLGQGGVRGVWTLHRRADYQEIALNLFAMLKHASWVRVSSSEKHQVP